METEERVLRGMLERAEKMFENYQELVLEYEQEVNVLKHQIKKLENGK